MKAVISRGFNDSPEENKVVVTIQCESKAMFCSLAAAVKNKLRIENYKRKQAEQSRLEYKINYSSSANTVS